MNEKVVAALAEVVRTKAVWDVQCVAFEAMKRTYCEVKYWNVEQIRAATPEAGRE
jgi:hypothetical protein